MKKHFVSCWFDTNGNGPNRVFKGLVTGLEVNGRLVVSFGKLFRNAFGYEMPEGTKINYG